VLIRGTVFDTAFGAMGLAWHDQALTRVLLPDANAGLTRQRLLRALAPGAELEAGESPPAFVVAAIEAMQAHLAGEPRHLREVPLDLARAGPFEQRVYAAARALDPGRTCTYGELARRIEDPSALRAVGQALGHNPWPLVVPCHRVLAAGGALGGFSAPGGADSKRRLLLHELAMCPREGELF
jgi:methylated-DNA-[protein]-cysteine S-methyltransferase